MLGFHCFFLILMSSSVSLFAYVFSWLPSSIYLFCCLAFWREAVVSSSWFAIFCGWRFEFCSSVVHVCFCQFFVVCSFWSLHVCVLLARVMFCFLLLKNSCFSFRWLPFACCSLDCICMVLDWSYYSFRGIILWFCFFAICWVGYFVFVSFHWLGWLDCIYMVFD